MRFLAFDTSTETLFLSLMEDSEVVFEQSVEPEKSNRQAVGSTLLPTIDSALKRVAWDKKALDFIVAGTGPGSFTGIRVGIICARSLAQALELPLCGVSTFEIVAAAENLPAVVLLSPGAALQHFFVAAYDKASDGRHFTAIDQPAYLPAADIVQRFSHLTHWVGDEKAVAEKSLGVAVAPMEVPQNYATAQARLVYDRLFFMGSQSQTTATREHLLEKFPWSDVLPLYLRNPSVTIKKNYGSMHTTPDRC